MGTLAQVSKAGSADEFGIVDSGGAYVRVLDLGEELTVFARGVALRGVVAESDGAGVLRAAAGYEHSLRALIGGRAVLGSARPVEREWMAPVVLGPGGDFLREWPGDKSEVRRAKSEIEAGAVLDVRG